MPFSRCGNSGLSHGFKPLSAKSNQFFRMQTKGYRAWFAANEHWLRPYAVFGFLRSLFGTAEHWRWGALGSPTPEACISSPDHSIPPGLLCMLYWSTMHARGSKDPAEIENALCCKQILERLAHPSQPFHRSLQFVFYVQYQLHRQLLAVSNYAEANRIALKGDLPIGELALELDIHGTHNELIASQ